MPVIEGKVTDSKTGEPIIGASISLDFKKSGIITDSTGYFHVFMPQGEYIIKVSHVGYKPFRIKTQLKTDQRLDVQLDDVTKTLEEVIVSSQATRKDIQSPSLGVTLLSIKAIKKLPAMMGEVDVIRSLQTLPGVSSVGEGSNGINVRGGAIDQNLIYIDGAPILILLTFLACFPFLHPMPFVNWNYIKEECLPVLVVGRLRFWILK